MKTYTKEQINSAILDEYKRNFGTLADENERNGYFIAGFVKTALENFKPPADCDKCSKRAVYFDKDGGAFCEEHCIS